MSRLVLYRREHAVALVPRGRGIVLWTLRYGDEVRPAEDYFPGGAKKFTVRFDPQSRRYWSLASIVHEHFRASNPGGIRNTLFGGEGLFFATLRGPGHVWIQSLPFSRLADNIIASAPSHGGSSQGEGSILGGLGRLIDGR